MKKLLPVAAFLLFAAGARAQQEELRSFYFGVNLGFPVTNVKCGVLTDVELKYFLTPHLGVGIKGGVGCALRNIEYDTPNLLQLDFALYGGYSGLLTADLYLTNKKVRPFIGAGYGIYHTEVAGFVLMFLPVPNDIEEATATNFGAMFRAGLNINRKINLVLTYNNAGEDGLHNNIDFYSVSFNIMASLGKKAGSRQ